MQAPTRARLSRAFRDSQEKSNRGCTLGPYSSTKASCRGREGERKRIREREREHRMSAYGEDSIQLQEPGAFLRA